MHTCKECIKEYGKALKDSYRDGTSESARAVRAVLTSKTCKTCKVEKPIDEFHNLSSSRDGKQAACKQCQSDHQKANRAEANRRSREFRQRGGEAQKAKEREYALKRKYGIDLERFASILFNQGGCCAICGCTESNGRNWHVDHDHACCPDSLTCGNCICGILCASCNIGIGKFNDDAALAISAAKYLAKTRTAQAVDPALVESCPGTGL